jgi:hypothetical protein
MNNDIQAFRFACDERVTLRVYYTTKKQQRDFIAKNLTRDDALQLIAQLKDAIEGLAQEGIKGELN